ncbi:MAG TPA: hypothetical protein VFG20_03045 [Planctomycetaceae bacterium]|nr:hypothetical protein [Planctomycetaceae bacterium]
MKSVSNFDSISGRIFAFALCGLVLGCGQARSSGAAVATPSVTATVADPTPGEVTITSAKASWQPGDIVQFDVAYKFTKGIPSKHYQFDFTFPGSQSSGQRPMETWETKPEGHIRTGLPVADRNIETFEVRFSEADSPDRGYRVISNVLTGPVEPLPATP